MPEAFYINLDGIQALCALQEQNRISLSALTVGLALCRYMGRDGTCWPSREMLGQRAGVSRLGTVSKAIQELVSVGFMTATKSQRSNRYQLHGGDDLTPTPEVPEKHRSVDTESAPTDDSC